MKNSITIETLARVYIYFFHLNLFRLLFRCRIIGLGFPILYINFCLFSLSFLFLPSLYSIHFSTTLSFFCLSIPTTTLWNHPIEQNKDKKAFKTSESDPLIELCSFFATCVCFSLKIISLIVNTFFAKPVHQSILSLSRQIPFPSLLYHTNYALSPLNSD